MHASASSTQHELMPTDAYLFFPTVNEIKNSAGVRYIFDGNMKFDDYETKMIAQFKAYVQKQNYNLKPMWVDNMILRFLQANAFKMDKTLASVKEHTAWKESNPSVPLSDRVRNFLEKGLLYVHGRDHKFRPIVVFSAYLISAKTFDVDLMIEALTFFFGYMIDNLLLPGQVENWIFITDLKGMGITSIPFDPIKKLLGFLQNHYRGRLYRMYIVNAPGSVYFPWQMVKKFLHEATVQKIQFYKQQIPEPLFEHANRDQVEQKYGGSAPDLQQYWPLKVPSTNYLLNKNETKFLVSKEEYISLYEKGHLLGHKINQQFIEVKKIKKVEPVQIPPHHALSLTNNLSSGKDQTADPGSCDSSPEKSKRQSEGFPTPDSNQKMVVKAVYGSFTEDCLYTEGMEEDTEIAIRICQIREFTAYFLSKVREEK